MSLTKEIRYDDKHHGADTGCTRNVPFPSTTRPFSPSDEAARQMLDSMSQASAPHTAVLSFHLGG
jgi:hypothetical protein